MDYQEGYSELVRECGFQFEEAYAITTKKLVEYCLDKNGKCEDMLYWRNIRDMLANDIVNRHMLASGYEEKKIGPCTYFEKER